MRVTKGADAEVQGLMGTTLHGGRYVISGLLGAGAQGDTLEAVDKLEGCAVAIKRFQVRGAPSWKEVELAEREARVLSSLEHPLVPRARAHFEQDGALYLVMDKVEGRALRDVGRLSREQVVAFLHDAAEVLNYLHGRIPPVIHRDIKPGNVIARPARGEFGEHRQRYVLVDFGSVRDQLKPAGGSTVVGTFGYMAPEQFQGRAKPASDIYAVGATALTMLTGREPEAQPHKGLGIDVAAALGETASQNDPALVEVLSAMLEPDPDKRPARLSPLLERLRPQPAASPHAAPHYSVPPHAHAAHNYQANFKAPKPNRKQRRRAKRDERRQRRSEREQQRRARAAHAFRNIKTSPRRWLPWPLRLVALIAVWVARFAVGMVVGMAVPLVLTLLSIVFGRGLRDAAKKVRRASKDARARLKHVRYWLKGELSSLSPQNQQAASQHPSGVRVETPPHVGRTGVRYEDVIDEYADEEAEIGMREAMERRRRMGL